MRSRRSDLSTVATWEIFTTLAFGKWASPFLNATFPGASACRRFEVIRQTTVVEIMTKRVKTSLYDRWETAKA